MDNLKLNSLIVSCLKETLSEIDDENSIPLNSINRDTRLLGRQAVLDSMGLVTLIVNIEQLLHEHNGIVVTIVDERAMSQEKSPFRTVGSLSEYISLLVEEQEQNG